jgi:hypothetical protein
MAGTFSVPERRPLSCPPPRESDARTGDQRADALRTAELVRRHGQGVGAERREIHRDLAGGLDGVDMQPAIGLADQPGRLRHGLDHAGLIVGQHQADQGARAAVPRPRQPVQVGDAVGVHRPDFDRQP